MLAGYEVRRKRAGYLDGETLWYVYVCDEKRVANLQCDWEESGPRTLQWLAESKKVVLPDDCVSFPRICSDSTPSYRRHRTQLSPASSLPSALEQTPPVVGYALQIITKESVLLITVLVSQHAILTKARHRRHTGQSPS
jgi:hypothetical protein